MAGHQMVRAARGQLGLLDHAVLGGVRAARAEREARRGPAAGDLACQLHTAPLV